MRSNLKLVAVAVLFTACASTHSMERDESLDPTEEALAMCAKYEEALSYYWNAKRNNDSEAARYENELMTGLYKAAKRLGEEGFREFKECTRRM